MKFWKRVKFGFLSRFKLKYIYFNMKDDDITCVFEGVAGVGAIFISNLKAAQNLTVLKFGIKAIVTVVKGEVVKHTKNDVPNHLYIPVYDMPTEDLAKYFSHTYEFIDAVRKKTNVLVHCYAGISRSATIVIAYLLRKYNYSLQNVITMVKRRRSKINPNQGFIQQLKEEAKKMGVPIPQNNSVQQILRSKPKFQKCVEKAVRPLSAYINRTKKESLQLTNSKKNPLTVQNQNKKNQNFQSCMIERTNQTKNPQKTRILQNNSCFSLKKDDKLILYPINTEVVNSHSKSNLLDHQNNNNLKLSEKIQKFKEKIFIDGQKKKRRESFSPIHSQKESINRKSIEEKINYESVLEKKLQMKINNLKKSEDIFGKIALSPVYPNENTVMASKNKIPQYFN